MSRREALQVLGRFLADEARNSIPPGGTSQSDRPASGVPLEQAHAYLKGLTTQRGQHDVGRSPAEGDEEKIFSDPFYWAPFVLIGGDGS
jgi:CHAT domain-containing protein